MRKLIDVTVVLLTILVFVGLPTFWLAAYKEWPFLLGFGVPSSCCRKPGS